MANALRAVSGLMTTRLAWFVALGTFLAFAGSGEGLAAGPAASSVQGKWVGTGFSASSSGIHEPFSLNLRFKQHGSDLTGSGFLCESAPCEPTGSIVVLVSGFFLDQTASRNFFVVDFYIQGTEGPCKPEFLTGTGRLGPTQDRLTLSVSGREAQCNEKSLTMTLQRQKEGP